MKKIFYTFLLQLCCFGTYAQHHLILGLSGTQHQIKTGELNNFANTFNSYYQGNGFKPLNDFKANMQDVGFTAGYRLMRSNSFSLAMLYMFSKNAQDNSTTLIQKSGYEFNYKAKKPRFYFRDGL